MKKKVHDISLSYKVNRSLQFQDFLTKIQKSNFEPKSVFCLSVHMKAAKKLFFCSSHLALDYLQCNLQIPFLTFYYL